MKKISMKKAKTEGVKYYILYPENAIVYKNLPNTDDGNFPNSKTKKTISKKLSRGK